jgi:hypothetical protein
MTFSVEDHGIVWASPPSAQVFIYPQEILINFDHLAAIRSALVLASGEDPAFIAIDATSVYWTNFNGGTVMKVSTAGGTPTTLASGQAQPWGIAVDTTNVYWTNWSGGTVMKVPIGSGTPTIIASDQNQPHGIAVDDTSVYWTNCGSGTVMKVPTGGGTPAVLASGQALWSIAVDATSVYWTAGPYGSTTGTVMKLTPK